jgi:tripartite-type tricarboxylate transporter receptor subunit TctC
MVKAGKLRRIALTSVRRFPLLPDLPTVAETVPKFQADALFALLAPAKTPKAVIDQLHRDIVALLAEPDFEGRLEAAGVVPSASTPGELSAYIRAETKKWAAVVKRSGAKI